MDKVERIGKFEAIILLITLVANNIIFNIPTILLNNTGTGAWINVLYLSFLSIIFIIIVYTLFKSFRNNDILDVSEYLGGKFLKFIVAILYFIYFITFSALALRYFANSLNIIYFNSTPIISLILLFLIPVIISNKVGLKAISGVTRIFFPFTFFGIVILFFAASKDFVWQRLFPILGFGTKSIFFNGLGNLFAFNVILYLFLLKPMLKEEKSFKSVSIISVIICAIYLLLSVLSLLMSFPFITETDEMFSLYLLTRLVSFGSFFQRIDAVFIFLWILIFLSFLSFNFYCIIQMFKKVFHTTASSEICYSLSAILVSLALFFKDISVVKYVLRNYLKIYSVILIFVVSFVILLLAYLKKKILKRKERIEN